MPISHKDKEPPKFFIQTLGGTSVFYFNPFYKFYYCSDPIKSYIFKRKEINQNTLKYFDKFEI